MTLVSKSNIVLIGFMASGKTTVGALLSRSMGMPLVDTDAMIEEESGRTIKAIFDEDGEVRFREMEGALIAREARRRGVVLAVGGGAVLDPANVAALESSGVIYLLEVESAEVVRRAGSDGGRPLLGGDSRGIESLMSARAQAYGEAADVVVDTNGRPPREIAAQIASDFESRRRKG